MNLYKKTILDYLYIIFGSFILALGFNMFLVPCRLSSGGVGTIATVFLYLFKIPLSVTNILLNAILFVFGYKYLGKTSVIKTVLGIIALSVFLEITKHFPGFSSDLIMSTVVGGVLVGVGIGFVIRVEASTGGSDFAALIIKRFFPHLSVATLILMIDSIIIAFAGIIFKSYLVVFYSAISMFISSKVCDKIITLGDAAKKVFIISKKSDEIAKIVIDDFARGITGIYSKGIYSGNDSLMLLCVVSPKEVPYLVHMIRSIDKDAFIIISEAREVLGEGFKIRTEYDKIKKDVL